MQTQWKGLVSNIIYLCNGHVTRDKKNTRVHGIMQRAVVLNSPRVQTVNNFLVQAASHQVYQISNQNRTESQLHPMRILSRPLGIGYDSAKVRLHHINSGTDRKFYGFESVQSGHVVGVLMSLQRVKLDIITLI